MNTKSLSASHLGLLFIIAAAPIGFACSSSDSPSGGGAVAPAAGAPGAGAPGAGAPSAGAPSAGAPSAGAPSAGAPSAGAPATGGGGGASAGAGGAHGGAAGAAGGTGAAGAGGGSSGGFTLTSPDQAEGAKFDPAYTCAAMSGTFGSGVNPELNWAGAPAGTMSYAITFIDTSIGDNMQMGRHWAMWDIPATVMKFPKGTKTLTGDFATAHQSGAFLTPCAIMDKVPNMDDVYEFTVWAVPTATLGVTGTGDAAIQSVLTKVKAITPVAKATLHGHAGAKGA